jgi:hypothetical protein
MRQVEAANAALMERTPFAIDDAKDEDDDGDESGDGLDIGGDDDQVMDEVRWLASSSLLGRSTGQRFCLVFTGRRVLRGTRFWIDGCG